MAQLGAVSLRARLRGDNPAAGAAPAHLPSVAAFDHRGQNPPRPARPGSDLVRGDRQNHPRARPRWPRVRRQHCPGAGLGGGGSNSQLIAANSDVRRALRCIYIWSLETLAFFDTLRMSARSPKRASPLLGAALPCVSAKSRLGNSSGLPAAPGPDADQAAAEPADAAAAAVRYVRRTTRLCLRGVLRARRPTGRAA